MPLPLLFPRNDKALPPFRHPGTQAKRGRADIREVIPSRGSAILEPAAGRFATRTRGTLSMAKRRRKTARKSRPARRAKASRRRSSKSSNADPTVNAIVILVLIAIVAAAWYLYAQNKKTSLIDSGPALATLAPYSSFSVVKNSG
jgi:hypothetical protein